MDAYHSGFPCSTFSKSRHNHRPHFPPPLRNASHPYGFPDDTARRKEQALAGNIAALRSIEACEAMAVAARERG